MVVCLPFFAIRRRKESKDDYLKIYKLLRKNNQQMRFFSNIRYSALLLCLMCMAHTRPVHASKTVVFGDSILASESPIVKDLETWSGVEMENYAKVGSSLQDGWVISIPQQYREHRDPVPKTIFLDGGGNDVNSVRSECQAFSEACVNTVDKVVVLVDHLLTDMREDGVENVIYSGFYHIPGFEKVIDYGTEELKKVCVVEKGCYFTDLRNVTVSLGWDGMHPVTESYHDIAKEIWKTKEHYNVSVV